MSALDHMQTFTRFSTMSALPPKADMDLHGRDVCFVPKADSCGAAKVALFDHFVGTADQCRWQINAERLRGFQIYKELKVRGQLKRQISRPGTAQYSGDEGSGVFANLALLRPI